MEENEELYNRLRAIEFKYQQREESQRRTRAELVRLRRQFKDEILPDVATQEELLAQIVGGRADFSKARDSMRMSLQGVEERHTCLQRHAENLQRQEEEVSRKYDEDRRDLERQMLESRRQSALRMVAARYRSRICWNRERRTAIAFSKWSHGHQRVTLSNQAEIIREMQVGLAGCVDKLGESIANTDAATQRAKESEEERRLGVASWSESHRLLEIRVGEMEIERRDREEAWRREREGHVMRAEESEERRRREVFTLMAQVEESEESVGHVTARVLLLEAEKERMEADPRNMLATQSAVEEALAVERREAENREKMLRASLDRELAGARVEVESLVADRSATLSIHEETRRRLAECLGRLSGTENRTEELKRELERMRATSTFRVIRGVVRRWRRRRTSLGFSTWRAWSNASERIAWGIERRQSVQENTRREEEHNLHMLELRRLNALRVMTNGIKRWTQQRLWRGFSKWRRTLDGAKGKEREEEWETLKRLEMDDREKDYQKKMGKLSSSERPDIRSVQVTPRSRQLVASVLIHFWHSKIERAWRKWREVNHISARKDIARGRAVQTLVSRMQARRSSELHRMEVPILRWRLLVLDEAREQERSLLLESVAARSVARKMTSTQRSCWSRWCRHLRKIGEEKRREERALEIFSRLLSKGKRKVLVRWQKFVMASKYNRAMDEHARANEEHALANQEREEEKARQHEKLVMAKIKHQMSSSLRQSMSLWIRFTSEKRSERKHREQQLRVSALALRKRTSSNVRRLLTCWRRFTDESRWLTRQRSDKSSAMLLARMSSSLRSTWSQWRDVTYRARLARIEEEDHDRRVALHLRYLLSSTLRRTLGRWRNHTAAVLHEKRMNEAKEMREREERERRVKATVRNILMTKVRNKYQRWCRYVRQEIMERELHHQKTTRVESMFLSNLAATKRSTLIRWREYVHEKKMEDLQAQADEKQVLQMIRNLLLTTTRRTIQRWHMYTLARRVERQHLKRQETFVAQKLASIMMSSLRYYVSRWHKHVADLKRTKRKREIQERKATAIMHKILRSALRSCMVKWRRYVFQEKLERKEIEGREARVLEMLARLVSKGKRSVLVRWHKYALGNKYAREKEAHEQKHARSLLSHGVRIATAFLKRMDDRAMTTGFRTWRNFLNQSRELEEQQDRLLKRVGEIMRRVIYRDMALVFHRLSRHAHAVQNHEERVRSAKRRIIRELIANVNRKMSHALSKWRKSVHFHTMEEIKRRHLLDRQQLSGEVERTRRESILMVQQVRVEQEEEKKKEKMIATIRRLQDKGMEWLGAGFRKWKEVHVVRRFQENGEEDLVSRRRERILAGASMLSLWSKGKRHSSTMKRFHQWRQASYCWGFHEQREHHRRQSMSVEETHRREKMSLQSATASSLRENVLARLMQRTLMSQRSLMASILQQWHVLAIHIAPLQRLNRRGSISHGTGRADAIVAKWHLRSLTRGFRTWSGALRDYHAKEERKSHATMVTRRVLMRMANREVAYSFHRWRRVREHEKVSLHKLETARQHERLQKRCASETMKSVVKKMYQTKIWRSWNQWCTVVGVGRVLDVANERRKIFVTREKMLYARQMFEPMIRWGQTSMARAFSSWAFHAHIGVRMHIRSRKRESLFRAATLAARARLPDSRRGLLNRGWNSWTDTTRKHRARVHGMRRSARIIQRVCNHWDARSLGRAWHVWRLADTALQLGKSAEQASLRIALQHGKNAEQASLRIATKVFAQLNLRHLSRSFHKWTNINRWMRSEEERRVTMVNHGFQCLNQMLFTSVPKRKLNRAFCHWVELDRAARQNEQKMLALNDMRSTMLSGLFSKRKSHERYRLAAACWRWSTNAASSEVNKLTSTLAKKKMHVVKLESKCTVYRNQQIQDAAVAASFEKELISMRQRMVLLQQNQEEEQKSRAERRRATAVQRLVNIIAAQERQNLYIKLSSAWVRWREQVGMSKQLDLAHKLQETRVQSRQAAGRISSLVEKAQRERAQTVQLLLAMKQRTTAMEEHVVHHLVNSPGGGGGGSGSSGGGPTIVTPAPTRSFHTIASSGSSSRGSAARGSRALHRNRKPSSRAKKQRTPKAKAKSPKSPVIHDPYNLIVDQLLTVVTSKKRTLYSHTITDLLTLFQAIDLNCDGNISDAEFQDAMKRLDINMTDNQLSYLLAEMRREDGRISYRGFVQSMQHHHDALQSLVEKSKKSGESSSMRRGTFFGLYKPEEVEE